MPKSQTPSPKQDGPHGNVHVSGPHGLHRQPFPTAFYQVVTRHNNKNTSRAKKFDTYDDAMAFALLLLETVQLSEPESGLVIERID